MSGARWVIRIGDDRFECPPGATLEEVQAFVEDLKAELEAKGMRVTVNDENLS